MSPRDAAGSGDRAETIDFPYDRSDFSPYVKAFLTLVRRGSSSAEPDPEALGHLRTTMPADLKALIHAWAHKSQWSSVDLGYWSIERRSLGRLPGINGGRSMIIGQGYFNEYLVATWNSGDQEARLRSVDNKEGTERALGTFSGFLEKPLPGYDYLGSGEPPGAAETEQCEDLAELIELAELIKLAESTGTDGPNEVRRS